MVTNKWIVLFGAGQMVYGFLRPKAAFSEIGCGVPRWVILSVHYEKVTNVTRNNATT